jgi:hypothetical protein
MIELTISYLKLGIHYCQKKKERKKEKEKTNSTRETDRTEHLITDPNNPAYVFHSPRALTNDPAT